MKPSDSQDALGGGGLLAHEVRVRGATPRGLLELQARVCLEALITAGTGRSLRSEQRFDGEGARWQASAASTDTKPQHSRTT